MGISYAMVAQIVQDHQSILGHTVVMGASEDDGALDEVIEESIVLVERWLDQASGLETDKDRKSLARLQALIDDPDGVRFTMRFVDRVARPDSNSVAAGQLAGLVSGSPLPGFLSPLDKTLLRMGARLGRYLPWIVMPLARRRMRQLVGHMVVDAEPDVLRLHLGRQRDEGYDLNVNLLGEAVLGQVEADRRMEATLGLLAEPAIDYVSIKLSSVVPQLNYWAWEDSRTRVADRLTRLFDAAVESGSNTFINLDMEEYHDLELTVSVFVEVISAERFASLDAGIVLQAYLPDSLAALQHLVEVANRRKRAGGGDIKIRLVKGANLAMERVEAAMHGWEQAPYRTKAETDANFKRLVDWVLTPEHLAGVRVGIGSHNLFDVAFAHLLAEQRGVSTRVEFEMLHGMSPGEARAVKNDHGGLLLYTPIVSNASFDVAISYLFRRLEENSAEENFLRILYSLEPGTTLFAEQAQAFRHSVRQRHQVGLGPQRKQNRLQIDLSGADSSGSHAFFNVPDSDPSLPANRTWAEQVMARVHDVTQANAALTNDDASIDNLVAALRSAQPGWWAQGGASRRQILSVVANEFERRRGDLIAAMVGEAAKTFEQADVEVSEAVDFARFYAERAAELDYDLDGATFTPLGVIGVIPPWNFPVAIPAGGVLGALAAGNAVALKPAPETPRCAEIVAECCWAAGVPREVLGYVRTPDNQVGKRLVTSVDGVILTGASETAAMFLDWKPTLRLMAETSGKNALVITPSADLDLAAQDLVQSAFGHAGQKCSAASLAILVGDVYTSRRFRGQLIDAVQSLVVGQPTDLATSVNPTILPVVGKLKRGLTQLDVGEHWLVEPRSVSEDGRLWSPGIRDGVVAGSWFHQTECFGPVLGLMFAETLKEAIELQNSTGFGLTGGIHSLDPDEVRYWMNEVEVGNGYVNRQITGAIVQRQPFGGWKKSTIGPGAKAGGPNYVAQLGTWTDKARRDDAWLAGALSSDRYWARVEFNQDHDPTGLFCEANIFRYRPLATVILRVGTGADPIEVERVRRAAKHWAANVVFSSIDIEDDAAFAARLERLCSSCGVGRIRVLGEAPEELRRVAAAAGVYLGTEPVVASGRIELLHYCREQAISQTTHRFGNLVL